MTAPFATPERVPANAVERLLNLLAELVKGLAAYLRDADGGSPAAGRLQRALGLLERQEADLRAAATRFSSGDRESLLQQAAELRLLARTMDGYDLAAAAETAADDLIALRQRVVLTAWQIAAAASGSEAAGL